MEETYEHRLDTYYLSTIGYGATLIIYGAIAGTMSGDTFSLNVSLWEDPIFYLLAACALIALIALVVTAILNRTVIVREHELIFRSRFRERVLTAEDIEWIGFRRETRYKTRGVRAYPSARIKLRNRRRPFRLRPTNFEHSSALAKSIRAWAERNGVEFRVGRAKREG
jgi:hypothetical protein